MYSIFYCRTKIYRSGHEINSGCYIYIYILNYTDLTRNLYMPAQPVLLFVALDLLLTSTDLPPVSKSLTTLPDILLPMAMWTLLYSCQSEGIARLQAKDYPTTLNLMVYFYVTPSQVPLKSYLFGIY